jgi:acetylornithine aminotransferase
MRFDQAKKREGELLMSTYARYPLLISRGQGSSLFDDQGRPYTDLLAGIAVCNLGHCHPELAEVICRQSEKLIHVSNLFYQEEQLSLAERLLSTCHLDRVFFCNSGAEANEAAIKLARAYMRSVAGREAYEIISLDGSFHGRTLATLTATGQAKIKDGFGPLPEGFSSVPGEDIGALESTISDRTAGVLLEVLQGEGGVRNLSRDYLLGVEQVCRNRNILFMIDEVQTGMGRTGQMWAYQRFGLTPDVVSVSKALANGLPMGALLASHEVSRGFGPGSHATTFGGGALVSAVAEKVLEIISRDGLLERAETVGAQALSLFSQLQASRPSQIAQVRGAGLMLGIELAADGSQVWKELFERGFICNLTQQRVLRLLPPLTIEPDALERFTHCLDEILHLDGILSPQ